MDKTPLLRNPATENSAQEILKLIFIYNEAIQTFRPDPIFSETKQASVYSLSSK